VLAFVAIALAVGLVIDQLREVVSFGRLHTDQDQTLIWLGGHDLLHGWLPEPNFFGQEYNTVFEGLPGAILHTSGVSWGTAVPIGTALMATAGWIALASAAFWRGRRVVAVLALAAPLVMRLQFLLLFDAPRGVLAGDLLAAVAIAIAVGSSRTEVRLASLVGLGGLAVLWDYAAALAVLPAFTYFAAADWRETLRRWRVTGIAVAVGAVLPVAWYVYDQTFYSSRAYEVTTASVSVHPHWGVFVKDLQSIGSFLGFFGPALAPENWVAVAVIVAGVTAVGIFAYARRSVPLGLAVVGLVVLTCLALSLNRASWFLPGLYFSAPRLLLPLPFGLWFLAFAAGDVAAADPPIRRPSPATLGLAIAAIAGVSLLVTQVGFSGIAARTVAFDLKPPTYVQVVDPATLSSQCTTIAEVYRATGAQLLADDDLNQGYACAAQNGLVTLIPGEERRGWMIQQSLHVPVRRMLVAVSGCAAVPAAVGQCTPEPGGVVLLRTPALPAARTLDRIPGLHVIVPLPPHDY
jgi:hypothetical protein